MPATVVTSQSLQQIATGQTPDKQPDLPPLRREVIALKRSGESSTKSEPLTVNDGSKKVDDTPKPEVKDAGAAPPAKPSIKDIPEDQLPEHVRKIIGKKHREMKEAIEFAEFQRLRAETAEKRAKDLESKVPKTEEPAKPAPAKAEKPKAADFTNVAEYTDALVAWDGDQREAKKAQQTAEEAETERRGKSQAAWKQRLTAVMESNPDFEDTVREAFDGSDKVVAKSVIDYIEESDLGPQLLYHLSKHPDDLAKFRSLNAEKAIGFLGRLEAKLEAPAAKDEPKPQPKAEPPKNVSQAPAPIDTTLGRTEAVKKDPSQMTTEEYLAHKRAERAAKRR